MPTLGTKHITIVRQLDFYFQRSSPTGVDTGTKAVVLITCFLVNFLSLGFALGLGVLFVPILEIFQTSRAVTSLMLSLCVGIVLTGCKLIDAVILLSC